MLLSRSTDPILNHPFELGKFEHDIIVEAVRLYRNITQNPKAARLYDQLAANTHAIWLDLEDPDA